MPLPRRALTDAAPLKALAHPLRLDLLESLTVDGPGTATELADRLGDTPSNCSWHLRKLAEHGFVTEVEGATGRSRPWQAAKEGLSWNEGDAEPETRAAGLALTEVLLGREVARLLAAREQSHREPAEWRDATSVVQSAAWLTAEEATEISSRLKELFLSHVERLHEPSLRPEGARLVSMVGWLATQPARRGRRAAAPDGAAEQAGDATDAQADDRGGRP